MEACYAEFEFIRSCKNSGFIALWTRIWRRVSHVTVFVLRTVSSHFGREYFVFLLAGQLEWLFTLRIKYCSVLNKKKHVFLLTASLFLFQFLNRWLSYCVTKVTTVFKIGISAIVFTNFYIVTCQDPRRRRVWLVHHCYLWNNQIIIYHRRDFYICFKGLTMYIFPVNKYSIQR